jgi:hypothetical protein
MGIIIRPADIDKDQEIIVDTLLRYLTPTSDNRRYDWMYKNNVYGPAKAWLAVNNENGEIVGACAAFPRNLVAGERDVRAYVLGDFCISDRYRSLGPALQLQRACLAEMNSGKIALYYDFPSDAMMAVYRRLNIEPAGMFLRLVMPLRVDRRVRQGVRNLGLADGLSAIGNLVLRIRNYRFPPRRGLTASLHRDGCSGEFSALAARSRSHRWVCVHRTAEYLNWRYLAHPNTRYEILTARTQGTLSAYAVFTQAGEDAVIVDAFGTDQGMVIRALLSELVSILNRRRVVTLSVWLLEAHPWRSLFRKLGFVERESRPVIIHAPCGPPLGAEQGIARDWFLMQGDRDI